VLKAGRERIQCNVQIKARGSSERSGPVDSVSSYSCSRETGEPPMRSSSSRTNFRLICSETTMPSDSGITLNWIGGELVGWLLNP